MSVALKELLRKNRERKNFVEQGNSFNEFPELEPKKPVPKEKPLKHKSGEPDQCFVIIPDVHSYERDKKAFNLCMKALKLLNERYNVTKVVQLGDLLEVGMFSSHPSSTVAENIPTYSEEIEWAINDFWKPAMKACPNANMYALIGNHEDRLNKWVVDRLGKNELAVQIYNDYMPIKLYEDLGIHVTPYGREDIGEGVLELFPGLYCIHGWSIAKNAPKAHLDTIAGCQSLIFGHTHRMQSDVRRNPLSNKYMRSNSFGSLAKVAMKWHRGRPMDHTLGFGLVFTYGEEFTIRTQEIFMNGNKRTLFLEGCGVIEE